MENRDKACFVYVKKGTQFFYLPLNLRNRCEIELVEVSTWMERNFFKKYSVKEWDVWKITGAKAGFTSKGYLRLHFPKIDTTHIWNKNTQEVYGICDYAGVIRANYKLCARCGKIYGEFQGEVMSVDEFAVLTKFKCLRCGHEWTIEKTIGRKRLKKERVVVGQNSKPDFYKINHRRVKPHSNWN
ncbi:MAG: hypothetical protein WCP93_03210 [Candidatus Berkelbacteria bacterium]